MKATSQHSASQAPWCLLTLLALPSGSMEAPPSPGNHFPLINCSGSPRHIQKLQRTDRSSLIQIPSPAHACTVCSSVSTRSRLRDSVVWWIAAPAAWSGVAQILIRAPPLTSRATLGKFPKLFGSHHLRLTSTILRVPVS